MHYIGPSEVRAPVVATLVANIIYFSFCEGTDIVTHGEAAPLKCPRPYNGAKINYFPIVNICSTFTAI